MFFFARSPDGTVVTPRVWRTRFRKDSQVQILVRAYIYQKSVVDYIMERKISKKGISAAMVHKVPADLRKAITLSPAVRAAWKDITPLARNEWICWIESAKKVETRSHRIERTRTELLEGKRRPCCWAGCIHR